MLTCFNNEDDDLRGMVGMGDPVKIMDGKLVAYMSISWRHKVVGWLIL